MMILCSTWRIYPWLIKIFFNMFRILKFLIIFFIIAIAIWYANSNVDDKIMVLLRILPFVN